MRFVARELRCTYQAAYPHCQITAAVCQYVRLPGHIHRQTCVHHIWGRKGPASEHWANYVTALPGPHDWAHQNAVSARIALTAYKLHLDRKDGGHFDADALKRGFGQHVLPWIEWKLETETVPEWCRWLWERTGSACPHERG